MGKGPYGLENLKEMNSIKDMYKNITENYDIQTVVSFNTRQNISKEVKSWVLIDDVT